MGLLEGIFGKPDAPPYAPPPLSDEDIRLAENEARIERALRESQQVSRDLAMLSGTLRMLVEEYRRVRG